MDINVLKQLILTPIIFQNICLEIIDVQGAYHGPEWEVSRHKHPWYEFNYVQSGQLVTNLNGTEFITGEGESLLIPPGVLHSNCSFQKQENNGFCIRFTLKKASKDSEEQFGEIARVLKHPRACAFTSDVSVLFKNKSLYAAQAAAINWLLSLYDLWKTDIQTILTPSSSNLSNQVILYLNEYYPSKIYVSDIAKALNMSYRNLARVFKKETGISIIEKLTEIRVNKAKQLLLTTDGTMLDIATAVGFENEYYFSNAFNDTLMQRPSQYRKAHRESTK